MVNDESRKRHLRSPPGNYSNLARDQLVQVHGTTTRGSFAPEVIADAASTNGADANHGAPQDLYSADALFTELDLGPVQFGSNSDKAFRFTATGKNASSSGYSMCFDYIQLVPQ